MKNENITFKAFEKKNDLVKNALHNIKKKWTKFKRRIHTILIDKIAETPLQFKLYRSYWHYQFFKNKENNIIINNNNYMGQKPDYGAGIGHQLANWNSGLYFANYFNLKFAHFPFSNLDWESILGFGEGETSVASLIHKKIKLIRLPRFNSENLQEIDLIRKIIKSYQESNILFLLEMNQGYTRQCDTSKILSTKFFNALARKNDKLIASKETFNIAVHIRRGDIAVKQETSVSNMLGIETFHDWQQRVLENSYYINILHQVLQLLNISKKIKIFIFSQGSIEEFDDFKQFENVNFCLAVNAINSFVEMVHVDLLISSKSSFSYKPALMSRGIKICPETFWHSYPKSSDFILANDFGEFDHRKFLSIIP